MDITVPVSFLSFIDRLLFLFSRQLVPRSHSLALKGHSSILKVLAMKANAKNVLQTLISTAREALRATNVLPVALQWLVQPRVNASAKTEPSSPLMAIASASLDTNSWTATCRSPPRVTVFMTASR